MGISISPDARIEIQRISGGGATEGGIESGAESETEKETESEGTQPGLRDEAMKKTITSCAVCAESVIERACICQNDNYIQGGGQKDPPWLDM